MGGADDRVFEIKCGCCGAIIHVDPRRRNVFYTEKPGEQKREFEERVERAKQKIDPNADRKWDETLAAEKNKGEKLEQLFREASEKAKEDPNERPPSIWDYD